MVASATILVGSGADGREKDSPRDAGTSGCWDAAIVPLDDGDGVTLDDGVPLGDGRSRDDGVNLGDGVPFALGDKESIIQGPFDRHVVG